jgi:hypothetical protein
MFNLMIGIVALAIVVGPVILTSIENSWSREQDQY